MQHRALRARVEPRERIGARGDETRRVQCVAQAEVDGHALEHALPWIEAVQRTLARARGAPFVVAAGDQPGPPVRAREQHGPARREWEIQAGNRTVGRDPEGVEALSGSAIRRGRAAVSAQLAAIFVCGRRAVFAAAHGEHGAARQRRERAIEARGELDAAVEGRVQPARRVHVAPLQASHWVSVLVRPARDEHPAVSEP